MPRYRLDLEYDGGPYNGFQAQAALPTIQGSIERAVKAFCGETLRLQAAGRTDTGVHALRQVIHIDLERDWKPEVVRDALNAHLRPHPVAVLAAAGATFEDVVKTTIFLVDMADFATVNPVYGERFTNGTPPARSTVAVAGLPLGARVEIEVIAALPR